MTLFSAHLALGNIALLCIVSLLEGQLLEDQGLFISYISCLKMFAE